MATEPTPVQLAAVLKANEYPVTIKMYDRPKFAIGVEKTTIIEEYKYAIEEFTGISWEALELVKEENVKVRLRNTDSGYEHGIKTDTVLLCVRCPLTTEDVRKVFVTGRVADYPARKGGLTISASDCAHTKRLDLTAKAFLPMLRAETCKVRTLKLSNCGVSDLGCSDLYEGLRHNKTLKHLVLSQNFITNDGALKLADALGRNGTLETLDLSHNPHIGDDGIIELCEVLTPDPRQPDKPLNTTLKCLDLSGTGLTDESARQLAGVIRLNTSLQELRLRSLHHEDPEDEDARMTGSGFWSLCEAIKGVPLPNGSYRESTLQILDLGHNPGGVTDSALQQLADSINTNKKMKKLRLAYCDISDGGANLIACGLEENEREYRQSADSAIEIILVGNKTLQELDLTGNSVSDAAMKAFARVLTSPNSGLKLNRLLLASNAISDTGLVSLALALQRNATASLIELDLSDNMISDVGARAMCLALEVVRNLQVLRLRGNLLSDVAKQEVRDIWVKSGRRTICLHL